MPDEPKSKFIETLLSMIPKDVRDRIGGYLGVWLFILVPMICMLIFIGGIGYVDSLIKKSKEPDKKCWQLQKIDNRIFKVNTCTGETEELKSAVTST